MAVRSSQLRLEWTQATAEIAASGKFNPMLTRISASSVDSGNRGVFICKG